MVVCLSVGTSWRKEQRKGSGAFLRADSLRAPAVGESCAVSLVVAGWLAESS